MPFDRIITFNQFERLFQSLKTILNTDAAERKRKQMEQLEMERAAEQEMYFSVL